MNDIERLSRRAQLAVLSASSATFARSHVERAISYASEGHLDIAIRDDLDKCAAALDRALTHAEQCRRRLLRKADRKDNANHA